MPVQAVAVDHEQPFDPSALHVVASGIWLHGVRTPVQEPDDQVQPLVHVVDDVCVLHAAGGTMLVQ